MRSFVVGLGHSGRDLHLRVLDTIRRRRRADPALAEVFDETTPLGFDPAATVTDGVEPVASLAEAAVRCDPAATMVHLCTPPTVRDTVVAELAELGFGKFLIEKPLGTDVATTERVRALRDRYGLDIAVVAPWLFSEVTARIKAIMAAGTLGEVRTVSIRQRKPRLQLSLRSRSHTNAFDVEPPHSVGVVLSLCGDATMTSAWIRDTPPMRHQVVPDMGGAGMKLRHTNGTVTDIVSDLDSPFTERRITVRFANGTVTGSYPINSVDLVGRISVRAAGADGLAAPAIETFDDDAMFACFVDTYRRFSGTAAGPAVSSLELNQRVVAVLAEAKTHCHNTRARAEGR
ncbi:hypothetical protein [Nocardia cyriacigeorgica]|uniref:hypothetical protein n=1 Tax=Nocardia cyriacigeorgica TaxID=135487 RepID=UPI001895ADEE|nr:hypothetical protein [Nocardia cyriacigeorgica]MBF6436568.1 hypothetical protein [Nocardia cyriacigeorgica]MBF6452137.1 hypothetical protein [Nocardia cyriacigeorgica]MBF6478066.1 hypothetical protein [Nocardia cyriacigeorgica]MBF6549306.1 hypothetical protein [Nocardia cyriacigeorgica]